jgi:beta-fructofuranosidase
MPFNHDLHDDNYSPLSAVYSGRGFSEWEIGDVDVLFDGNLFHLFHLIIPNHDYIAHAICRDGVSWKRVQNALFVGDPGRWDDDMLWTMHTTWSESNRRWEMYYTGLCMEENGAVQRIGMAVSDDLYTWTKLKDFTPIESQGPYYESVENNPRTWISFRDPFLFKHNNEELLLTCARSSQGQLSRRGCTAVLKKRNIAPIAQPATAPVSPPGNSPQSIPIPVDQWELQPPLVHPFLYDDMECPCLVVFQEQYYLIASIREDRKVRYWVSSHLHGKYQAPASNVLLPQGNFAARVVRMGSEYLVYSFFFVNNDANGKRVLPPPRQLECDEKGELFLSSFKGWHSFRTKEVQQEILAGFRPLLGNPDAKLKVDHHILELTSEAGHEFFVCDSFRKDYIWEGKILLSNAGKFGLIANMDDEGSGYLISLDITNGFAQIRAWGVQKHEPLKDYLYKELQANHFHIQPNLHYTFQLINYGHYIELSLDGKIILSLVDYTYTRGKIGLYCTSTSLTLTNSKLTLLRAPEEEYAN